MALSDNCIAFVKFDSGTLTDLIGGHAVTATGAAFESASPGPAWNITSGAGYISVAGISLPTPCTVAVQVYVPGSASSPATLIGVNKGTGTADYFQLYQNNGTNAVVARSRTGGTAGDATDGVSVAGSAYNNVGGVFTSSTSRQAYRNGTLSSADTTSVSPTGTQDTVTLSALYDGGSIAANTGPDYRYKNLAIWTRTLTQAELDSYFTDPTQVLSGGGSGAKSGLNFFYRKGNGNV